MDNRYCSCKLALLRHALLDMMALIDRGHNDGHNDLGFWFQTQPCGKCGLSSNMMALIAPGFRVTKHQVGVQRPGPPRRHHRPRRRGWGRGESGLPKLADLRGLQSMQQSRPSNGNGPDRLTVHAAITDCHPTATALITSSHTASPQWLAAASDRGFVTLWDLRFQLTVDVWRCAMRPCSLPSRHGRDQRDGMQVASDSGCVISLGPVRGTKERSRRQMQAVMSIEHCRPDSPRVLAQNAGTRPARPSTPWSRRARRSP